MGSKRQQSDRTPDISIDEALKLFLAITYPNGPPEGVDAEELVAALRKKIVADRPAWAASEENQSAGTDGSKAVGEDSKGKTYSRVKAEIAEQAQREEVPEDPEEKYFYERRKQARENRERSHAESREDAIREDLRRRLIAEKKEPDSGTLERAFRVRQVLEERVRSALELQHGEPAGTREHDGLTLGGLKAPQSLETTPPSTDRRLQAPLRKGLDHTRSRDTVDIDAASAHLGLEPTSASRSRTDELRESVKDLRSQSNGQQIETIRRFNRSQKADLKPRRDYLAERRPPDSSNPSTALTLGEASEADAMGMTFARRPHEKRDDLEITTNTAGKKRGLELD